ncbi:glycosyl transferase [Candidatus Gracilibacteria bacterium]|nr:MAG: glycosyl transferase [Candidatus Gracilibacteria bacterium]
MKKITFLISSLAGGGAEGVCVNLANGLSKIGWEVELVVLNMNNSVFHKNLDKKVKLVVLNVNNARFSLFLLVRYFKKIKLKKVVVFNYELTVMTILARYFCRNKFKVIARNINTISQNRSLEKTAYKVFIRKMVDFFYKKADQDDLVNFYPEVKNKVRVIYNPVRMQIETYTNTYDFQNIEKENYILCVGRLEKQKAFHYAIEAFAKLTVQFPALRLKIVGKGSLENELKELSINLGIMDRIDFEGFSEDIISYYSKAKLVWLTSLYEGFPNVLIESISLGTPVVAFDCPSGSSEIITEDNGCLVEYLSSDDLVEKTTFALNKNWDYKQVYNTASKYKIENIINQWEEVCV